MDYGTYALNQFVYVISPALQSSFATSVANYLTYILLGYNTVNILIPFI